MNDKEEEEARQFVKTILEQFPDEPAFFNVKDNTVNTDWAIWYAANTSGNPDHTFAMLTVKMLVLQVHLSNMIEVYWEEESQTALRIIKNNPQIWPLLSTLRIHTVKPTWWERLRNQLKRIKAWTIKIG